MQTEEEESEECPKTKRPRLESESSDVSKTGLNIDSLSTQPTDQLHQPEQYSVTDVALSLPSSVEIPANNLTTLFESRSHIMNDELEDTGPSCQFGQEKLFSHNTIACGKYVKFQGASQDGSSSYTRKPLDSTRKKSPISVLDTKPIENHPLSKDNRKRVLDTNDSQEASKLVKLEQEESPPIGDSDAITTQGASALPSEYVDDKLKDTDSFYTLEGTAYLRPERQPHLISPSGNQQDNNSGAVSTVNAGASDTDTSGIPTVPRGLQAPVNESIKVIFHVVVPLQDWEWDYTSSFICLRFGHLDLGNWKYNCGHDQFQRRIVVDGLCEMTCELNIQAKILKSVVPYKYFISSTKKPEMEENCYEVIPIKKNSIVNRALCLSKQLTSTFQREFHQYDVLACPGVPTTPKSWLKQTADDVSEVLKSIFKRTTSKSITEKFKPPDTHEIFKKSLSVYLEPYKQVLLNEPSVMDQSLITKTCIECVILNIFMSLQNNQMKNNDVEKPFDLYAHHTKISCKKTLMEWIQSVVADLEAKPYSGQRIASALSLTCLIKSVQRSSVFHLNVEKVYLPLARLLFLQPALDTTPKQCTEWDHLLDIFPTKQLRTEAAKSIHKLLSPIMKKRNQSPFEWLCALPLHNFLKGISSPFEDIASFMPKKLESRWTEIQSLTDVRFNYTSNSEIRLFGTHVHDLEKIFILDPSVILLVTNICPKNDLGILFHMIPPNVSIVWLSRMVKALTYPWYPKSTSECVDWIKTILDVIVKKENFKEAELLAIMESSVTLFRHFTSRILSIAPHCIEIICSSLELALNTIANFENGCPDENKYQKEVSEIEAFKSLDEFLQLWIKNNRVIGGVMFGARCGHLYGKVHLENGNEEMNVWNALLKVHCSLPSIEREWQMRTRRFLTERVQAIVCDDLKLNLLEMLEVTADEHDILISVIIDSAIQAVDSVFAQSSEWAIQKFDQLSRKQSMLMGRVLGSLVSKKYPDSSEAKDISLDDLLEWYLWPKFFLLYDSGSQLTKGLPEDCSIACACAVSKFKDKVCPSLISGDITLNDLAKIGSNEQQMKHLCEVVTIIAKDSQLCSETLQNTLQERLSEFRSFKRWKTTCLSICNWVESPDKGFSDLKQDLEKGYGQFKIRDLCITEDGDVKMKMFSAAHPLSNFASNFSIMTKWRSNLFVRLFKMQMKRVSDVTNLTIASIPTLVWDPVFDCCRTLLDSLVNLTIKLADVDKCLGEFKNDLETQVFNFAAGVWECQKAHMDKKELSVALDHIKKYWKLCEYRDGAGIFLELNKALQLQGDFKIVQTFSTEFAKAMKDQTLADIDDSLIQTGQFLDDVARNPVKKTCLETFVKSQGLVEWLKTTANDVSEIQNFVTVALATAVGGEGVLIQDKLSHLRTVGSGFASLIYNISPNDGYKQLEAKCVTLWEALKDNPRLPKLLEDCNKDLSWYQSVRDTQGSVEKTSYGQMRNILKYGNYCVGVSRTRRVAIQSVHDLIEMKLEEKDKEIIKKVYTLDELRDLESKLVLICGNKEDSRTEVDHFLNLLHNVTRIAEVFLDLRKAGNVKHFATVLEFICAKYDSEKESSVFNKQFGDQVVECLQEHAKNMEALLEDWEAQIQVARSQYYPLNYYTTLQLCTLRREFGRYKGSDMSHVLPNVLALLCSVSPDIDNSAVKDAVLKVTTEQLSSLESSSDTMDTADEITPAKHICISAPAKPCHIKDRSESQSLISVSNTSAPNASATKSAPLTISVDDLTAEQKQFFTQCVTFLYFSECHVLRALQECGPNANKYDIEEWCESHEDSCSDTGEQEMEDVQLCPIESSEKSDQEFLPTAKAGPASPSCLSLVEPEQKQAHASPKSLAQCSDIKTTISQAIHESHPIVQEVFEVDNEINESMESYGELGAAMDFLDYSHDEVGISPTSISELDAKHGCSGNSLPGLGYGSARTTYGNALQLTSDPDAEKNHLTLNQLGRALQLLTEKSTGAVTSQRKFNSVLLKSGHPNLLVTSPDRVLLTVLTLYVEDKTLPLPTPEEVLICNPETTTEEVTLLWQRAIFDPGYMRIFCLAQAERLSYQVCDAALRSLSELSQGMKGYRLVIVCSKEEGEKSHIISRLHLQKRAVVPVCSKDELKQYLTHHFKKEAEYQRNVKDCSKVYASTVDQDKLQVRVVSSTRSGMGKSLYIQRLTEELRSKLPSDAVACVTIPVHGSSVTPAMMLSFLDKHMTANACTIYHLDIAPSILPEVDTILFSLLILQGLTDSNGRVWRCHSQQLYAVEVTLPENLAGSEVSQNQTLKLLDLLPSVKCISPQETLNEMKSNEIGMDDLEFRGSTIQRVYQYLRRYVSDYDLDCFSYQEVEGNVKNCLNIILPNCGIRDPSWSEIHHFTKFLNIQLHSCEQSDFFSESNVRDVMSGLKGFVVKFMIRMSQDFSTPSLEGVVTRENSYQPAVQGDDSVLNQYQITFRRKWEQISHPYIFFNHDGASITFVGFRVTPNGDLLDPVEGSVIEQAIMRPQLYTGLKQNGVNFDVNCHEWTKYEMIIKIAMVMGMNFGYDPDETYVLTVDNLIKILAIQMRFRCDIPVVIMGETGCGKTRLIRYMCDLAKNLSNIKNMLIMKIHGGITDGDIVKFIERAETTAKENKKINENVDTVVFFDEANTTDSIGLIKEIMCDRRIHGSPISKDLKFIAACNPYRRHQENMIKKLETAGLGYYVRASETQQKLGKIPLRQLVYRVLDLPRSMRPLVYDFGQLKTGTEHDYVEQIVRDHVMNHDKLSKEHHNIILAIVHVLAISQDYMRQRDDECSFVSLRDVERAMIVFEYFYDRMETFTPLMDKKVCKTSVQQIQRPSNVSKALVLAVSVCYHARLQDRKAYEDLMAKQFQNPLGLPRGADDFRDVIKCCQEVLLDNMKLGPNIARNAALRENVFMMAICIELRIPLFLVGKPGSSKSLAKSIIQDSMHGKGSQTELLRGFKQVHMFSYQCSQLSTPESVIEVFQQAETFQSNQDTKQYVSVVVLDEVGLAEDSPNLPLKALHPLLEDGTEGAGKDDQQKIVSREKRVAFIGISNWALDPAKMNRGVMVTRGDPGLDELKLSAKGICSNIDNDPVRERLQDYFDPLSRAYWEICLNQEKQFFGLRDFYSLIKMLYWMCERSNGLALSAPQLEHAIRRNFGGLESDDFKPVEIFKAAIDFNDQHHWPDFSKISEEDHPGVNPDCSKLGLIKTSLSTKDTTWHGENRYLLFLTENYAALDILEHYLKVGNESIRRNNEGDDSENDVTYQPFVLFGSSFPKDKEYTQICRNINQIKICMETGRTVILLNLENLYESLYDVLNQYYLYYSGIRYVDLGLQTHRVKCRVHENFKLILIAEKNTVYEKFPTPLINRLEKHFVLTSSVLEEWQQEVLKQFELWIQRFSHARDLGGDLFKNAHAFIGYQKDTPAAVIFQATNQLKKCLRDGGQKLIGVFDESTSNQLTVAEEGCRKWQEAVMKQAQYLLLQTASEDALFRLKQSKLSEEEVLYLMNIYYHGQEHASIVHFLKYIINEMNCHSNTQLFMQVTTHSHLMDHKELKEVSRAISIECVSYDLNEFDTELDFSNKIGPELCKEDEASKVSLVIIQCDSGHLNSDLIACARYRVLEEAVRANSKNKILNQNTCVTHVLFIIHLPPQEVKSQFVGFQGDLWVSVHIDDLRKTSKATVIPEQAIQGKLSELFIGMIDNDNKHFLDSPLAPEEFDVMSVDDDQSFEQDEPSLYEDDSGTDSYTEESLKDLLTDDESNVQMEITKEARIGTNPDPNRDAVEVLRSEMLSVLPTAMPLPEADPPSVMPLLGASSPSATPLLDANSPPNKSLSAKQDIQQDGISEKTLPNVVIKPDTVRQFIFHPQHRRLYGCIQAAVASLNDSGNDRSKERLQKLMSLIPKSPEDNPDDTTFYGLVVKVIHSALKDREKDRVVEKDWVVIEAMNRRKLHNGGTFRNVLARRVDEVITPLFSTMIATVDQNCNLNLLENDVSSLSRFWLDMFNLVPIDFSSMAEGKTTVETDFPCQLPFSWRVKEAVDGQLANINLNLPQRAKHAQSCESLGVTELGQVLSLVSEENCEQFYERYVNDFVRIVHKSKNNQKLKALEHQLLADALQRMVHASKLCSMNGHKSLIHRITALHLAYTSCRSEIHWFGQLVLHNPGILTPLTAAIQPDDINEEFTLHLSAVDQVLSGLESPVGKVNPASILRRWLYDIRLSQNVINSIFSLSVMSQSDIYLKRRLDWQRIQAVKMFVEHVMLPHSDVDDIVSTVQRLDVCLKSSSDFLAKETLDIVKAQLNEMDKKMMIDNKVAKAKMTEIKKSCQSFFIEVVSSLCFGGGQAPEPELIKTLMDTVLSEKQTRELSPYDELEPDKTPTIRSFLLQLLLEHSPEQVMEYLDDYFQRSCQVIGGSDVNHGLCLLCIQCFEDSLVKRIAKLSVRDRAQHTIKAARDSYAILQDCYMSGACVSVHYLEAIATIRYMLSVVAENLKHNQPDPQLLHIANIICTDKHINTIAVTGKADTTGPVVYLLKLLVRQYGFPCLKHVTQTHPWVTPQVFRSEKEEQRAIDPFIIYQLPYISLRDAMNTAAYAKEIENLSAEVKIHTNPALFALALYQQVTLSHISTLPVKQLPPEATEVLNEFILNHKALSPDMMKASRLLLANQQGGTLAQMTARPRQQSILRTIGLIVVHTASVILCQQKVDILFPFLNIFNDPTALVNAYLPTMQEDLLQEVRKAGGGGNFYECPNGHPYFVGECGRPMVTITCQECHVPIGGTNHKLLTSNKTARVHDTTNTGHDLGAVSHRHVPQGRERHLSAPAVCIVRAIMHSSFIWSSCTNEHNIEALAQLVKPQVVPHHLPEFFWHHLQRDIEDLSTITLRGTEECAMIVHLVLQQILMQHYPTVARVNKLHSKKDRQEWERLFSVHCIEPVLEHLDKKLKTAMDLVAKDDKQEHDRLFYLAYEQVKVNEQHLEPHLWSFRSRITIDHLRNSLMQQKKDSVKIIDAFLQDEQNLRATQYLPDIVKFQYDLYDMFNRRLERSKAKSHTIREFLKDLKNEYSRHNYQEKIDSLKKAWALVGHKLVHHKRLPVDSKYLLPAITDDTKLEYLIPTTLGEGRCTTSLVDFLVLTHNNFIETCWGLINSRSPSSVWRKHKIPITHIHRCHLLDYEQQLQSIILSHCHYSLTVGKGQDIEYDLPALEKHILNRFIYGKPMIELDIPHVAYRKDVYTTEIFLAIRQRVKPQVLIPSHIKQEIIAELRTPDRLRESLDVVDIMLGFLSSGGGNPKVTLRKYIDTYKIMKTFSTKAKEYCNLEHVISLWETISVELARQLLLAGQEPFESFPENYSLDLDDGQVVELDKCLRTFDLGLLLGSLFEFIEVHVKHTTAKEEDWMVVEAMEIYRDLTNQEQMSQFSDEFPQSITVDKAMSTWKHIVHYQEGLGRH